jgi:hypothetical protein
MFMRPSKSLRPAPSGQDVTPVAVQAEDALAYFTPAASKGSSRELTALEQMYGYWSAE